MLKKLGISSVILGVFLLGFGMWMLDSSGPFSYWGYSSGMRTIMEFAPWMFMILGAFGLLGGIFYLIQDFKPITKIQAKVVEKNGNQVVFEFENGSRKTLTTLGNMTLVIGDMGVVEYKGTFVTDFNK